MIKRNYDGLNIKHTHAIDNDVIDCLCFFQRCTDACIYFHDKIRQHFAFAVVVVLFSCTVLSMILDGAGIMKKFIVSQILLICFRF